jgi:hypothetical protein
VVPEKSSVPITLIHKFLEQFEDEKCMTEPGHVCGILEFLTEGQLDQYMYIEKFRYVEQQHTHSKKRNKVNNKDVVGVQNQHLICIFNLKKYFNTKNGI